LWAQVYENEQDGLYYSRLGIKGENDLSVCGLLFEKGAVWEEFKAGSHVVFRFGCKN
jgi:hypothetical protein